MQFYYGDKNLLRALDEAQFWKHQEKEHTVVIRKIVPNLEPNFVAQLNQWELELARTEAEIVKVIESVVRSGNIVSPLIQQQVLAVLDFAAQQSQQFVNFLNAMKRESAAVRNNMVAQTVIDHIIRESMYFIGIMQTVLNMPL